MLGSAHGLALQKRSGFRARADKAYGEIDGDKECETSLDQDTDGLVGRLPARRRRSILALIPCRRMPRPLDFFVWITWISLSGSLRKASLPSDEASVPCDAAASAERFSMATMASRCAFKACRASAKPALVGTFVGSP
jgi:hypothetical protein